MSCRNMIIITVTNKQNMYKLMKRIYLLLSLLLCSLLCMSQVSTSQNYISTRTYTSPDQSGCREQVVYFDGLGRPSQTVDCGITPDRKDLVSLQEYDDQGRKLRTWSIMPITIQPSKSFSLHTCDCFPVFILYSYTFEYSFAVL